MVDDILSRKDTVSYRKKGENRTFVGYTLNTL